MPPNRWNWKWRTDNLHFLKFNMSFNWQYYYKGYVSKGWSNTSKALLLIPSVDFKMPLCFLWCGPGWGRIDLQKNAWVWSVDRNCGIYTVFPTNISSDIELRINKPLSCKQQVHTVLVPERKGAVTLRCMSFIFKPGLLYHFFWFFSTISYLKIVKFLIFLFVTICHAIVNRSQYILVYAIYNLFCACCLGNQKEMMLICCMYSLRWY